MVVRSTSDLIQHVENTCLYLLSPKTPLIGKKLKKKEATKTKGTGEKGTAGKRGEPPLGSWK